ncbi:MAG TPA: 23S rRNA (adenine(2503)-C(2))-methyltransferase RlmN [Candidatus Wallbacteria bacterium]|nr:MAG: Dual-specificity RNA methyltransferase RlmN [bacterium ADurb.Bin243]HOD39413.1 23S rRNA (adenine(2503)-C(2))-methyltransferase RlmN [Candidatus Wallbacteria bacterium]HPG56725.1 23S rRNA (adenine(2503)-C(2))-methyltransferase RlmN [Candidatus Wallbacteria bacterium]
MNEEKKIDICGLELSEFERLIEEMGEKAFRARQVYGWIFNAGVRDFAGMTDIPSQLRTTLAGRFSAETCRMERKSVSGDKMAVKYALSLADGNVIETVKIYDSEKLDKYTVCVSTQVGCPVNCAFCQTARMGFIRNLSAAEITGQVLAAAFDGEGAAEGLSNVVYMGMGEPLLNYDSVVKSVRIINCPKAFNVSMRKITVSTAGVAPMMKKLMNENMPITLALSLHAPTDALRDKLVPLNRKHNIKCLIDAVKAYARTTGRRVTIEYVLIDNVNDKKSDAVKLAELLKNILCHVNLIPMNKTEGGYSAPSKTRVAEFKNILMSSGVNATVRSSRGQDINAACGMLYKQLKKTRADEEIK